MNGIVYVLSSPNTNSVYIGSTTKNLKRRMIVHKSDYKKYLEGNKKYVSSFEIFKYGDCEIETIKEYDNITKKELCEKEGHYIKNLKNCVNIVRVGRTQKEYYVDNKEHLKKKANDYYKNNKNKLQEKQECPCGGKYTFGHKERHLKSKKHILNNK